MIATTTRSSDQGDDRFCRLRAHRKSNSRARRDAIAGWRTISLRPTASEAAVQSTRRWRHSVATAGGHTSRRVCHAARRFTAGTTLSVLTRPSSVRPGGSRVHPRPRRFPLVRCLGVLPRWPRASSCPRWRDAVCSGVGVATQHDPDVERRVLLASASTHDRRHAHGLGTDAAPSTSGPATSRSAARSPRQGLTVTLMARA